MIKSLGSKYVIIDLDNRSEGDNDKILKLKLKNALKNNLQIIFVLEKTNFIKK